MRTKKNQTQHLEGLSQIWAPPGGGFDFEQFKLDLAEGIKHKRPMSGKDGLLAPLIKQIIEATLEGELDVHLSSEKEKEGRGVNRRNGHTSKVVKGKEGAFSLSVPRDRAGSFEPEVVKKRQSWLDEEIEERILDLYSSGMSYRDISEFIERTYLVEVSAAAISAITDRITERLEKWRARPLERVYCCLWLDAIHYRIRSEQTGRVEQRALHCLLGQDSEGRREVLGLYLSPGAESARFWATVLDDLKRRGVEDVLLASTDGLKGFADALEAFFPQCQVQACIVHQVRSSVKYVPDKLSRELCKDLKEIYQASSQLQARQGLEALERSGKWDRYPLALRGWRENFDRLTGFMHYPQAIRKIIYTTNPIEAFHRQLRRVTKAKGAFVSEQALMKLLFVATLKATNKWGKSQNWAEAITQFHLLFPDRIDTQNKK